MKQVRDHLYDSLVDECDRAVKLGYGTGCYIEKVLERQKEVYHEKILRPSTDFLHPAETHSTSRFLGATLMDAGGRNISFFPAGLCPCSLDVPKNPNNASKPRSITVIGSGRMPNLADYDKLPYLRAFINEVRV